MKNNKVVLISRRRLTNDKYYVFTGEVNKIALSANSNKRKYKND